MSGGRRERAEAAGLPRLPGELRVERLDNGLTVALQSNRQAPVVSCALWYRVGTRDEAGGQGGIAHFLEHMMFKGSERYGPGEIDRRTQALGGANNAFTSHDTTVYYFQFAADRWTAALDFEVDRMRGLRLDPGEVESERRVILEEIGMYEDDPWDSLGQRVESALYLPHPYGRPVLGTREDLLAIGPDALRAFHARHYTPANAVLVIAGDFGEAERALAAVEETFGSVSAAPRPARDRPAPAAPEPGLARVVRRKGEAVRMLFAAPLPPADHSDLTAVRVALAVLGVGRSSRLYRDLVDERQLCAWIAVGLAEAPDPGAFQISAEILDDIDPRDVERELLRRLAELVSRPPEPAEIDRAREVLYADWIFAHETISQQGLTVGSDLTFFGRGWSEARIRALADVTPEEVARAAERWVGPGAWAASIRGGPGAVLGWALPPDGRFDLEAGPVEGAVP